MPKSARVVRVWCEASSKCGSGYRIDARRVLTARHVVDNADDCHVRLDGDTRYRPAEVLWRGFDNVDIAVLEIVEDAPTIEDDDPEWAGCRWVDGECRAAGYPTFLGFADGPEREEFVGQLRPLAGIEYGRVHAEGNWIRPPKKWAGMSGAALFSGGCLIGVVTEAMNDRLLSCPISKQVVPFDRSLREPELVELEEFCVPRGHAMLVVTGPGGPARPG